MATPESFSRALLPLLGKRLLDTTQTAEYLGTTAGNLRQLLHHGQLEIPFVRRGRKILFDIKDLDAYCDALPRHSAIKLDEQKA